MSCGIVRCNSKDDFYTAHELAYMIFTGLRIIGRIARWFCQANQIVPESYVMMTEVLLNHKSCIIVCERSLWTNVPDDDLRNPILTSHDIMINFPSMKYVERLSASRVLTTADLHFYSSKLSSPTDVSKSTECIFVFAFTKNILKIKKNKSLTFIGLASKI